MPQQSHSRRGLFDVAAQVPGTLPIKDLRQILQVVAGESLAGGRLEEFTAPVVAALESIAQFLFGRLQLGHRAHVAGGHALALPGQHVQQLPLHDGKFFQQPGQIIFATAFQGMLIHYGRLHFQG